MKTVINLKNLTHFTHIYHCEFTDAASHTTIEERTLAPAQQTGIVLPYYPVTIEFAVKDNHNVD